MDSGFFTLEAFQGKVFRPLLAWAIISFFLLTWHFHCRQEQRASIDFTVSLEGRDAGPIYQATLDGQSFDSGRNSGLWRKRLTIQAQDADPFSTNLFVWYGGKHLGNITLTRSRGTLDLSLNPTAVRVSVDGAEAKKDFHDITHESLSLPTGRYQLTAAFSRFATNSDVAVFAHQTTRVVIDPGITVLSLSSHPSNAEFELNSAALPRISIRSNTPTTLTDLPAGDYHLRIWRDDYEKIVPFRLNRASSTNELKVEFDYAQLAITSQPDGAEITDGDKRVGTTPATLTLPAGWHRLTVAKNGFRATNFSLTLEANKNLPFAVVLPSRAYLEAMEQARGKMSGLSADLDRALESAEKALQIQPDDATALELKEAILFQKHVRDARELRRNGLYAKANAEIGTALRINENDPDAIALKRDLEKDMQSAAQSRAEARRAFPAKVFQDRVFRLPYSNLFPSEKIELTGQMETARAAIVRALLKSPSWTIRRNEVNDEAAIIQAEVKSFGSRHSVFFVVGQTTDTTVEVHFKLWFFSLGGNIQIGLGGFSDESYKPVHPSFEPPTAAATVKQRRARDLQEFRKRLDAELR